MAGTYLTFSDHLYSWLILAQIIDVQCDEGLIYDI